MIIFLKNLKFGTAENLAVRRFALEPVNPPDGPDYSVGNFLAGVLKTLVGQDPGYPSWQGGYRPPAPPLRAYRPSFGSNYRGYDLSGYGILYYIAYFVI